MVAIQADAWGGPSCATEQEVGLEGVIGLGGERQGLCAVSRRGDRGGAAY